MPKNKSGKNRGRPVRLVLLGMLGLGLLIKVLLYGHDVALFNPKGLIAHEQLNLIIFTIVLLLVIAIPSLFMLYFTAWKYRESNVSSEPEQNSVHSKFLVPSMWLIPSSFMLVLALVMWPSTHQLAPQKAIASTVKPLTIQVISMRWKWLFIYPDQKIATVNFVQIPVNTPVKFELTADGAPMSSFWIPNLGGMLYSMTGMVNELNLMADTSGDYRGSTAEINGAGFAGMRFTARASSKEDFDQWVQGVRVSADPLDSAKYDLLVKPSEDNPVAYYSGFDANLYDKVLMKYMGPSNNMQMQMQP